MMLRCNVVAIVAIVAIGVERRRRAKMATGSSPSTIPVEYQPSCSLGLSRATVTSTRHIRYYGSSC